MSQEFTVKYGRVMARVAELQMPMRTFCLHRNFVAQDLLFAQFWSVARMVKKGMPLEYAMWCKKHAAGAAWATNAVAGESAHNWEMAGDTILKKPFTPWQITANAMVVWRAFGDIVKGEGLAWGGDWQNKDLVHCELPGWEGARPKEWRDIVAQARDEHIKNVVWSHNKGE